MRIILAASGSRGDVQPMVALAGGLQAGGHSVLVCASPNHSDWVRERGVPFLPMGRDFHSYVREHAWRANANPIELLQGVAKLLESEVESQFASLLPVVKNADLVVGGSVHLAAASVAELMGVPYRYLFYCPQFLPSSEHPPWILPWSSLPTWANRLSWQVGQSAIEMTVRPLINRLRTRLGLRPIQDVLRHLVGSQPILAADPALSTVPADVEVPVLQTGALQCPASGRLPDDVEAFVLEGEPPVYIGFGSVPDPNPNRTADLIFESMWALGRRALISGEFATLNGLKVPPHCKLIPPLDHALLLPRMAAVAHHGGAGTTSAAARAGVPQVVVPHLMDQHYWGHQVFTLGMGPRPIWRRHLTARRLTRALQEALANSQMRARARSMAARLRATDPVRDTVGALLRGLPQKAPVRRQGGSADGPAARAI
ncbi:MAG: glycosyltransferase [Myxococcota bacterium]